MTPNAAVAENLDQFVARPNQSRLSRMKLSTVVPACMYALENVTAEWKMEFRASRESRILWRITRSVRLLRKRKSRFIPMVISPERMWFSWEISLVGGELEESSVEVTPLGWSVVVVGRI